ncbi:MAG: type II secretion system protein [Acidobacteria bacterium]|nr:type II secretion system protein [Acidobacteriota bacterium]
MRVGSVRPSIRLRFASADQGFTLLETLVALAVLLTVMSVVMTSMIQFSQTQSLVWNRANMHGAVRSATELLQQEVGQAGRVSLAPGLTTSSATTTGGSQTVNVTSTTNMFVGEQLVIDAGQSEETVTVTAVDSATSFTATFALPHNSGSAVTVRGGFASGVVPTTMTNGSTGGVLKLYGDVNGDGNMVYVEYVCATGTEAVPGFLYRNTMSYSAASKAAPNAGQILLTNLLSNPGNTPCFTYEQKVVNGEAYVINVAITLTTQTQFVDRITRQFQTETKALLNVAPRNVFEAWQLASMGSTNRIQPMPATVTNLLAPPH